MIWPLEALREGNWTVVNLWIVAGVLECAGTQPTGDCVLATPIYVRPIGRRRSNPLGGF